MKLILQSLAAFSCGLIALGSITLFRRFKWPAAGLWVLKMVVSSLSPLFFLVGILTATIALSTGALFIGMLGLYVAVIFLIHIIRVTRSPVSSGFENAFGLNWEGRIKAEQKNRFLPSRSISRLPVVANPRLEQNIPFASIPGTDRKLCCDLWQPSEQVSGLVFIYLHGSAWYLLDKDMGTRPLFSHLAAQGHTIMDVAYRLAPETDMMGMIHDAKRAINWMKENAGRYGINAKQIVIGGGSAGAHLALMAAYTSDNSLFTPLELEGKDLSVHAVVSLYGPTDLEAMYYHTNQHLTTRATPGSAKNPVPQMPKWVLKAMGDQAHRLGMDKDFTQAGALATLFHGHPDQCPDTYALFSPLTHVHAGCPPTLLLHGEQDCMVPVKSVQHLYACLKNKKVKTVLHILPQTDHAFDLVLPAYSPSAHNAFYDIERFLALQLPAKEKPGPVSELNKMHQLVPL